MSDESLLSVFLAPITGQFVSLKHGNVAGSVCRLSAADPVPLYDTPTAGANVMRRMQPGTLVVAFSDPGPLRQVNTVDQYFGYIDRGVTLLPVPGVDPEQLYDPEKRAAVEAALPPLDHMVAAHSAAQKRLKFVQYCSMTGFALLIGLGMLAEWIVSASAAAKP